MTSKESELDELLELIGAHVDIRHCREVDERYTLALAGEEVDRPPLVVKAHYPAKLALPHPWERFRQYTYSEAFDDPVAMMQNELLASVVPGLLLKDDSPSAIRNNHGTIQMASLLGGKWEVPEDDFPWVRRFESVERIREIAASSSPVDLGGGILRRSLDTVDFYLEKLGGRPVCKEGIQVAMPDLQGPLDTAEQIWGSDIYYAFLDDPNLLNRVLARIVDVMLVVEKEFRKRSRDRLDPAANTQHGYMIPGRLLIRNDSAIMLSAEMYAGFVRPHDARLLREVGGGSIHFCGNGEQLIDTMLSIPDLRGVDMSQPELMDLPAIYAKCRERGVAVTGITVSREDLLSGKARRDFPTGCVFVYEASGVEDAREVLRAYGNG